MIPINNIQSNISIPKFVGDNKQVLLENSYFKIIKMPTHLEMECLGGKMTTKRELSVLAIFLRKYYELTGINKLLLFLPGVWGLEMPAWELIRKKDFFGFYFLAFIATELYQNLLLRGFERSNSNLKIFRTREQAVDWLSIST